MIKRGNKKGQFYLMAAIVIIAIIIGWVTVSNSAKKSSNVEVYDVKEELGIESQEVLDFGIVNESNMSELLTDFGKLYTQYAGDQKEIYLVYGNRESVIVATYSTESVGGVSVIFEGGSKTGLEITEEHYRIKEIFPEGGAITIRIGDKGEEIERTFDLQEGENFYFIITQTIQGEQYVAGSIIKE